jgi:uncharacterized protein YjiS (DUF1127 family)
MASLTNFDLLLLPVIPYLYGANERRLPMGIRQTLKKWAAYQQTVRELASLDNRQLNDLGISRGDIQRIARDHVNSL